MEDINMKNLLKLLGVVLVATFFLVSCKIEKGGTIEVTNALNIPTYVIIVKGIDYAGVLNDLSNGEGTLIESGAKASFDKDDDGYYTVVASPPAPFFYKSVFLSLGKTETVTVHNN
jgi:hypothetical protein